MMKRGRIQKILKTACFIPVLLALVNGKDFGTGNILNNSNYIPLAFSQAGNLLLTTDYHYQGLALTDTREDKSEIITDQVNAGYYAGFSPDQ